MTQVRLAQPLCRPEQIAEGGSAAFEITLDGLPLALFVVRRDGVYHAFVNACPHTGAPLDWVPGRFLDAEGEYIQCDTHYALFRIDDGVCVLGPCAGQALRRLGLCLDDDGWLCLAPGPGPALPLRFAAAP